MYKFILVFFFSFFLNYLYAEDKIVYLDVNYLLSHSEVGKYVNNNLKNVNDKNNEEFKKIEIEIKSDEEKLLNQQNILNKDDYDKKFAELRSKFKSYQEKKKIKKNELSILRNDYSKNNSISLIIEKKNIIIGKTDLDVTNDILKLLNKKITKIEFK